MIDLLLEKLESDSQVFKTVVQNFFKRYAKPSCFSSEENISRNKLSETSAINTFRKMASFFGPIHLLRKRSEQLLLWTQISLVAFKIEKETSDFL